MASLPSAPAAAAPVTLETLHAALEGAVSLLKEAQSARQREEAERRQRLDDAKARLADYMQAPRRDAEHGLQAQPNLYKLFLAIDLAEDQPVKLWSTVKYIVAILWMTLAGIFARLDMEKIIKTLTHNSPSTGYRLRLKKGLDKYALAVRASVGAQTVCREARQDFCAHALSKGVGEIDLDAAVNELALPYPSHLQRADDKQEGVPDLRFGNDIAEARAAIEQLIVSTVVARYIARMDELVAYIGTLLVAFLAFIATILILAFPPSLLLSQLGARANTADPPCSLRLVGPGFPGTCIKPIDPIEDGTSLYKVHVYVAICSIAAPIFWVCAAGIAMQVMLGMTLEVLKGVDHSRARVMFEQHPLSPAAVAQSIDRTKAEGKDHRELLIDEGRRQLKKGEFGARAGKPSGCSTPSPGDTAEAAAAEAAAPPPPPPPPSSLSERFNAFIALLMPAFKNEIEASRDGVLCMETEDFLETYDMMREDVADASQQVGINVSAMMTLITQGLAGLAVFLVVVSSMTFVSGQRFVVIALFVMATIWVRVSFCFVLSCLPCCCALSCFHCYTAPFPPPFPRCTFCAASLATRASTPSLCWQSPRATSTRCCGLTSAWRSGRKSRWMGGTSSPAS